MNLSLTDVDGLSMLNSIGGDFLIGLNEALTNIDGFSSLIFVEGDMVIEYNQFLAEFCGLYPLLSNNGLAGSFTVADNAKNPSIQEIIDGAACQAGCIGNITLTIQDAVDNFTCTEIPGTLAISGSDITDLTPLSGITSIGRILFIGRNEILTSIAGLDALQNIGGYFCLLDNPALLNLEGISSLSSIGGSLLIASNDTLANVDGLSSLTTVGDSLLIDDNKQLSEFCGLFPLLSSGGLAGLFAIEDNAQNPSMQDIINGGLCAPFDLYAENITKNSALLGCTANGSVTGWEIMLGITGFDTTGVTPVQTNANPYQADMLTPGTTYDFYMRSEYNYGISAWAGPAEFTTLNDRPVVAIIYPATGETVYDYSIIVSGTASDPDGNLSGVSVELNGGGWEPATGTDTWTKELTLTTGVNIIRAKAADAQGLESLVTEVKVILSIQIIPLIQGWSLISTYLESNDPSLETILAIVGIPGNLTIMLGQNGIFWPEFGINTIGPWNTSEGYKVKYKKADELIIRGNKLSNNSIVFGEGFNIIPVLTNVQAPISQIFSDPVNDVKYLFDLNSDKIYWPVGGITTLTELTPGRGYLASFNQQVEITFPPLSNFTISVLKAAETLPGPWNITRTATVHLISISTEAVKTIPTANYIGAFNSYGKCVGYAAMEKTGSNILLTMYGKESLTNENDGLSEGEIVSF
ncbi:MAG: hypothetical protein EOM06_10090, partial [Sphingobacteriia bacterium]|nr:hypothetical protein [Sphingobacteriia bacterium]